MNRKIYTLPGINQEEKSENRNALKRPGIDQEGFEKTRKESKKTSQQSGINQEAIGKVFQRPGSDQEVTGNQRGRKITENSAKYCVAVQNCIIIFHHKPEIL